MRAWNVFAVISLSAFTVLGQGTFGFSREGNVFEQLPLENHNGEIDSSGGIIRAADDFVLSETTTIRSLLWWGGPLGTRSNGTFSVILYEDANGFPGSVIPGFGIGPVQEFPTGTVFVHYPEFQYLAPLAEPFIAESGVRYWLSIARPPDYSWGWEASSYSGNYAYSISGQWYRGTFGTSFALSTAVPEPSGIWLILCAGFAAAFLSVRRPERRN